MEQEDLAMKNLDLLILRRIVVHNGRFHADDALAAAILRWLFPDAVVVRTRDPAVIEEAIAASDTAVVDVGGVHDPARLCFDHHQTGGAGMRDNVPYAASGLVWEWVRSLKVLSMRVWQSVEDRIVQPIDNEDNGIGFFRSRNGVRPFTLRDTINMFRPTWNDPNQDWDAAFTLACTVAQAVLQNYIAHNKAVEAIEPILIKAIAEARDPNIVVLEQSELPLDELAKRTESFYAVHPDSMGGWRVQALHSPGAPTARKLFPKSWRGKSNSALARASGVGGAVFCHDHGFVLRANSRGAAMALARRAADA